MRTDDGAATDAKDEEEGTGKPPPDVRVVLHPDNGVACAVRLSAGVPLTYSPSLASAWSGTLTPAHSAKLDGTRGVLRPLGLAHGLAMLVSRTAQHCL